MKTFTVLQAARRFDARGFNALGDDLGHTADVVETVLELAGVPYSLTPPDDSGEERFMPAPTGSGPDVWTPDERLRIAARCLEGMLANPEFEPAKNPGERSEDAYARRAVDHADALLSRLALSAGKDGAQ